MARIICTLEEPCSKCKEAMAKPVSTKATITRWMVLNRSEHGEATYLCRSYGQALRRAADLMIEYIDKASDKRKLARLLAKGKLKAALALWQEEQARFTVPEEEIEIIDAEAYDDTPTLSSIKDRAVGLAAELRNTALRRA